MDWYDMDNMYSDSSDSDSDMWVDEDEYDRASSYNCLGQQFSQFSASPPQKVVVVENLKDLAAAVIGQRLPFELVEQYAARVRPVPDFLQLAIMKAAFPRSKSLVRTHAFLSGVAPTKGGGVSSSLCFIDGSPMQIGFSLVASVGDDGGVAAAPSAVRPHTKATCMIRFDRGTITSLSCPHHGDDRWCPHLLHLAYRRIETPQDFLYRLPISDSVRCLSSVQRMEFISYLLDKQHSSVLAFAQETLDGMLRGEGNASVAPPGFVADRTAGGCMNETATWCLDDEFVKKSLSSGPVWKLSRQIVHHGKPLSIEIWLDLARFKRERAERCQDYLQPVLASPDVLMCVESLLGLESQKNVVSALDTVTSCWMFCLSRAYGRASVSDARKYKCTYSENANLLGYWSRNWNFPDWLIGCWRLAALMPRSGDDVHDLQETLQKWSSNFSDLMTHWISIHSDARKSMLNWQGFAHVSALLRGGARQLVNNLASNRPQQFSSSSSLRDPAILLSYFRKSSVLKLACHLIEALLFWKCSSAARRLATATAKAALHRPTVGDIIAPDELSLLDCVYKCYQRAGPQLYGKEGATAAFGGLRFPLLVLHKLLRDISPREERFTFNLDSLLSLKTTTKPLNVSLGFPTALALHGLSITDGLKGGKARSEIQLDAAIASNEAFAWLNKSEATEIAAVVVQKSLGKMLFLKGLCLTDGVPLSLALSVVPDLLQKMASNLAKAVLSTSTSVCSVFYNDLTTYLDFFRRALTVCCRSEEGSSVSDRLIADCFAPFHYDLSHQAAVRGSRLTDYLSEVAQLVNMSQIKGFSIYQSLGFPERIVQLFPEATRSRFEMTKFKLLLKLFAFENHPKLGNSRRLQSCFSLLSCSDAIEYLSPSALIDVLANELYGSLLPGNKVFALLKLKLELCPKLSESAKEKLTSILCKISSFVSRCQSSHFTVLARRSDVVNSLCKAALDVTFAFASTAWPEILFYLSKHSTIPNREKFQVGLKALKRFSIVYHAKAQSEECGRGNSRWRADGAQDFVVLMSALSASIDQEPLQAKTPMKRVKLAFIENWMEALDENWIDPLLSFNAVLQVARLWGWRSRVEEVLSAAPGECSHDSSSLAFLEKDEALTSVSELCKRLGPPAQSLIKRCKTSLISKLEQEWPPVSVSDLVVLQFILKVFPDKKVKLATLLKKATLHALTVKTAAKHVADDEKMYVPFPLLRAEALIVDCHCHVCDEDDGDGDESEVYDDYEGLDDYYSESYDDYF